MGKVQRLHSIKNWDALDDYYGKNVQGIIIKKSTLVRSFCRCGYTDSKIISKCPKCNNYIFEEAWRDEKNNTIFPFIIDKKINKNYLHLYKKALGVAEGGSGEIILKSYKEDLFTMSELEVSLSKDYQKSVTALIFDYDLEKDILKNFEYEELLKEYSFFIYDEYSKILKIIMAYVLKIYCKEFTEDKFCLKYPYLTKCIASQYINYLNSVGKSYWTASNTRSLKNRKTLLSYIDMTKEIDYEKLKLYENIAKYSFDNYSEFCQNKEFNDLKLVTYNGIFNIDYSHYNLNSFLNKIKNQETGKENLLFYYVSNGLLSYIEAINIIDKIITVEDEALDMKYFDCEWKFYKPKVLSWWQEKNYKDRISFREFFDESFLEFFDVYLKENLVIRKKDLIEGFIEQIHTMLEYDIPLKESNFKLKTYNYYLNTFKLAEVYKLPEGKVNLFLDMFEKNPLEATNLIRNRRKLTDKDIEQFLKKI